MSRLSPGDFTRRLIEWQKGDKGALDEIMPVVYSELRRLAASRLRGERPDHTLQPTALIHEAYLRLVDQEMPEFRSRSHFFGVASAVMRQILVDSARAHRAQKRGGGRRDDWSETIDPAGNPDIVALDDALLKLARVDERKARAIEMQYFGGLTVEEIAEAMGSSGRSIARELRSAKAFLFRELGWQSGSSNSAC